MKLIENGEFDGISGYYTASFVVSSFTSNTSNLSSDAVVKTKDAEEKAKEIETVLNELGIVALIENYNLKDVWMGTIPGMVRSNVLAPILGVGDVSSLLVLPLK